MDRKKIAVVGTGLIGRSWAMLFASAGYKVSIYDSKSSQVESALNEIKQKLEELEERGLLRGTIPAAHQFSLISGCSDLASCVEGARHIQECIPENLSLKQKLFTELDELVDDVTVLGSSTSCISPSKFTQNLKHRNNAIVTHPANPPYFVPIVEMVPAPWTDASVVKATRELMVEIGQSPVTVKKDCPGFVSNRIQYSILNECWRMVENDILSVEDIDTMMKDGIGMRYAFIGPLETCHLNAEGWNSYCERYAETIHNVSQDFGATPSWEAGATRESISAQLEKYLPLAELPQRRSWRDERLAELFKLKRDKAHN